MKKKIGIIIGGIICLVLLFYGGYYFANRNNNKNSNKTTIGQSISVTQQKIKEENKIDGLDLGNTLTKDQFHQAESLGKKYKNKNTNIEGINQITNDQNTFQKTYGGIFVIYTPYVEVIDASKKNAEQYKDITDKNTIQTLKDGNTDINTFQCIACVGGDSIDFLKNLHMVLRVYGKNETKVLQPQKIYIGNGNSKLADTSKFFPNNPLYSGGISGTFNAKDIVKLNPQKLEIIVVYPDGKEVKQSFDYNKLNQL
ncbi:hypothetical protein [Clostridium sp. 001]|uniref:hypothetical protein n=1 Tax=Clostridium sp. 001 TaxID=1970093 RepID=UPI001C2C081F|nr:hypothetical protein [Clostridium sp. 001]QXE20042.1 hypothetical protein B5S50_15080 [Clostridium sp. 001]